jgi:hypothetical protein
MSEIIGLLSDKRSLVSFVDTTRPTQSKAYNRRAQCNDPTLGHVADGPTRASEERDYGSQRDQGTSRVPAKKSIIHLRRTPGLLNVKTR